MSWRPYCTNGIKNFCEIPSFSAATEAYIACNMHETYASWHKEKGPIIRELNENGDDCLHLFSIKDIIKVYTGISHDRNLLKGNRHLINKYRMSSPLKFPSLITDCGPWSNLNDLVYMNRDMDFDPLNFYIGINTQKLILQILLKNGPNVDILNCLLLWMYGSIGGWMFNMYLKSFSNHGNKEASLMIRALLKSSDIMYRSVYNVSRPEDFDELRQNQNFLYSITKRLVIEALSDANSSRKSLASVLTSLDMSIEQITTAFVGIFQESVEPVSLTLTWALYHLARSPEVQEIFRKKIRKIISLSNYQPNLKRQRIPNRQYLEDPEIIEYFNKIIAETFRLNYPTIGLKRILQTSRIISGYSIPANTLVLTQNQLVGRMAKYFEDPLIFNPERRFEFKSMVLMPYGIGRVCGGAWFAKKIMLIALVNMVSSFEISYNYEDIGYINKLYNQPSRRIILTMKETKI